MSAADRAKKGQPAKVGLQRHVRGVRQSLRGFFFSAFAALLEEGQHADGCTEKNR
jgi:hypothetical protein